MIDILNWYAAHWIIGTFALMVVGGTLWRVAVGLGNFRIIDRSTTTKTEYHMGTDKVEGSK